MVTRPDPCVDVLCKVTEINHPLHVGSPRRDPRTTRGGLHTGPPVSSYPSPVLLTPPLQKDNTLSFCTNTLSQLFSFPRRTLQMNSCVSLPSCWVSRRLQHNLIFPVLNLPVIDTDSLKSEKINTLSSTVPFWSGEYLSGHTSVDPRRDRAPGRTSTRGRDTGLVGTPTTWLEVGVSRSKSGHDRDHPTPNPSH